MAKIRSLCPQKWYINGNELAVVEQLDYLGAALGNKGANTRIDNHIRSCRKAFYGLQNVGLCNNGLNVDTAIYVFKATCLSILTNGCKAIKLTKKNRDDVDKLQARILKCIAGLGPRYRSVPLLQAMGMHSVSKIIDIRCIQLLCNIMKSDSAARSFYMMMLHDNMQSLLINRVKCICNKSGVNVYEVMFHEKYVNEVKKTVIQK